MSSQPFRSWSHWIALGFLVLVGLSKTTPLDAQAQTRSYPVSLELLAPTSGGNKIPTVTWGGWPIILKMTANREIGIGWTPPFEFPVNSVGLEGSGQGFSAIVFEEPDDCHSWTGFCETVNETYLDFRPGGASSTCSDDLGQEPVGVASLVLLADVGEGENGVNLASHFNNVGYELDDVGNRTNVVASMVVPNGMVTPPVTTDLCVGTSQTLAQFRGQLLSFDALLTALNVDNVTTFRAFVVNRTAPTQLSDQNADGVISARDAELSGFSLLSREVVFRVRTFHQIAEFEFAPHADLDGNGSFFCPLCATLTGTRSSVRIAGSPPAEAPSLPRLSDDGLCAGIVCDDNNVCTTDTCDPATGCVFTPNPPCNDNDPCTDDTCDPATGCVFTPNSCCASGGGGLTPVPR